MEVEILVFVVFINVDEDSHKEDVLSMRFDQYYLLFDNV